jgi:2-keto-4-pentenoate hydratase/2-oxohepta-3-ene-1,7-dioic acid hydratase in catechol pathway
MRIAVYGPWRRVGAVVDDVVIDLNHAHALTLSTSRSSERAQSHADAEVPAELGAFIAEGDSAIEAAENAIASVFPARGEEVEFDGHAVAHPLRAVRLHAPIAVGRSRLFMALGNYAEHVQGAWKRRGDDRTVADVEAAVREKGPTHFIKHQSSIVSSGDPVRYPRRTEQLDFEAEVAVVIGSPGRDIAEKDFTTHVWGVVLLNDWSVRDYVNRERDFAYTKNFDTSCTVGPWISVGEVGDVQDVTFQTEINGTLRQFGNTSDMIFSFAEYAAYLSRDLTLRPGDLISAGTCTGTGADISEEGLAALEGQQRFLREGDEVVISSPQIGTIHNVVHAP